MYVCVYTYVDEAMDTLVTRILELASHDPECAGDFVDLGEPDTTAQAGRLTPNTGTRSKSFNSNTYEDTNGYSKVVNLKGLAAAGSGTGYSEPQRQQSSCCS